MLKYLLGTAAIVATVAAVLSALAGATTQSSDYTLSGLDSVRSSYFVLQNTNTVTNETITLPKNGFAKASSVKFFIQVSAHVGAAAISIDTSDDGESWDEGTCAHSFTTNTTYVCTVGDNTAAVKDWVRIDANPGTSVKYRVVGYAYAKMASIVDVAGGGGGGGYTPPVERQQFGNNFVIVGGGAANTNAFNLSSVAGSYSPNAFSTFFTATSGSHIGVLANGVYAVTATMTTDDAEVAGCAITTTLTSVTAAHGTQNYSQTVTAVTGALHPSLSIARTLYMEGGDYVLVHIVQDNSTCGGGFKPVNVYMQQVS